MTNEELKKMAAALSQVAELEEAKKKKLDKVDKDELDGDHDDREDKDIDNDGDVDKSDEYLHNRRKAVSKAVKNEEAGLDEVLDTPKAMDSYRNKAKASKERAASSATAKMMRSKDKDYRHHPAAELKTMAKRTAGERMAKRNAARKTYKAIRNESVELEEARWEYKPSNYKVGGNLSYDDKIDYNLSKANADILNKYMKQAKNDKERSKVWNMFWSSKETGNKAKGPDMAIAYAKKAISESVELDEGKNDKYPLYHKDFSGAMKAAYDHAKKNLGVIVDPSEIDDKVATGPKKPSTGKTNFYRLTDKSGKKAIQVQVYNTGKSYELNMYKEDLDEAVELDENYRTLATKGMGAEGRKDINVGRGVDFYEPKNGSKRQGTITKMSAAGYEVKDDDDGKTYKFKYYDPKKAKSLLGESATSLSRLKAISRIKKSGVVKSGSMSKDGETKTVKKENDEVEVNPKKKLSKKEAETDMPMEDVKWTVYERILEKREQRYRDAAKADDLKDNDTLPGKGAKDMDKDMAIDKTTMGDKEKESHDTVAKAERAGPSTKARNNDNKAGDKKIVNPVKGMK